MPWKAKVEPRSPIRVTSPTDTPGDKLVDPDVVAGQNSPVRSTITTGKSGDFMVGSASKARCPFESSSSFVCVRAGAMCAV